MLECWKCKRGTLPDVYLGAPLGASFKNKDAWGPLIANLRERLAAWKKRYITKAGRLVLVKSTLASIPIYLLSLFVIPCSIREEIEQIARNFLWGTTEEKKQFHLVRWEEVCIGMDRGGLGIKNLREVNISLMCKWLWKLGEEGNPLWKRLIKGKYGMQQGRWFINKSNKSQIGRASCRERVCRYV